MDVVSNTSPHILSIITNERQQCLALRTVWITTVGLRLKSDQHGSMAARTGPGRTYGRLTIACQYSLQCACVLIVLADSGQ